MSETQDIQPSSEFEIPLADLPEPEPPGPVSTEPEQAPSRYVPGRPLPRLWKAEPDPEEESAESSTPAGKRKGSDRRSDTGSASAAPEKSRPTARREVSSKPKRKKPEVSDDGEKRVLLEETPALDTIESRQRARLIMGGLMIFCVAIFGWIIKGMIFGDSGGFTVDAVEMPPEQPIAAAGPRPSNEPYARYMLDRAREYAERKQVKHAQDMLAKVVAVYKGTKAAAEAQAALGRSAQGLPLFPAGPVVLGEKALAEANPAAAARGMGGAPVAVATGPGGLAGRLGMTPRQLADMATAAAPHSSNPAPIAPGSSTNPGTVGPAPPPTVPGRPNVAGNATAPPSNPPGGNPRTMPGALAAAPPSATGPVAVAPPPAQPRVQPQPQPLPLPPGPGDTATLIPASPGSAAMPPAADPRLANDRNASALSVRPARKLPPGFRERPEAGRHESGWPYVIVGERDGGTMVLVPGGNFTMGTDHGDPWEGPAHTVRLSTYYIDQYEVTNRQFRTFLEKTNYVGHPPGKWLTDEKHRSLPDDAPAVFVSYHDAEDYAIWALKRIATEAQWEMAARSSDARRYPWGNQPIRFARPRKFHQVEPVTHSAEDVSPAGVFGMAGNAVEWVRDWYDPDHFKASRAAVAEDPAGPPTKRKGIKRTVKGGSKDGLVYYRDGMNSDRRAAYLGFRCSLAVEGGEASAGIVPRPPKSETPAPAANPGGGQAPGGTVPF